MRTIGRDPWEARRAVPNLDRLRCREPTKPTRDPLEDHRCARFEGLLRLQRLSGPHGPGPIGLGGLAEGLPSRQNLRSRSVRALGYVCTVQHSDFKWFPAGTEVHYTSQNQAGDVVQATIPIKNGSTNGACVWSSPVNAVCTFSPGSGRLTQFHLVVDVTANADQSIWYWDGTYWFDGGD